MIGGIAVDVPELVAIRSALKEMITTVIEHSRRDRLVTLTVSSTDEQLYTGVGNHNSSADVPGDSSG